MNHKTSVFLGKCNFLGRPQQEVLVLSGTLRAFPLSFYVLSYIWVFARIYVCFNLTSFILRFFFFIKSAYRIQILVSCKPGQVKPKAYFSHLKLGTTKVLFHKAVRWNKWMCKS